MIISMGVREIRPFMKCRRILDLVLELDIISLVLSPTSLLSTCLVIPSASLAYIRSLLLGILFTDDKW